MGWTTHPARDRAPHRLLLAVVAVAAVAVGAGGCTGAATPSPEAAPAPGLPQGWPTTQGPLGPAGEAGTPTSQTRTLVPTVLVLPSGVRVAVEPAGVRADGTLQVPDDPSRVGWWTGGAQVGEPFGGVVLAGHVDSRRFGLGALAELLRVRPGAGLALGDGALMARYRVDSVVDVPKADLSKRTGAFRQDVPHRLVLITCSGAFDRSTHRYADNLVVTAVPID